MRALSTEHFSQICVEFKYSALATELGLHGREKELAVPTVFGATFPLLQSMARNMKSLSTATEQAL